MWACRSNAHITPHARYARSKQNIVFCIGGGAPNRLFYMRFALAPRYARRVVAYKTIFCIGGVTLKDSYYIFSLKSLKEL